VQYNTGEPSIKESSMPRSTLTVDLHIEHDEEIQMEHVSKAVEQKFPDMILVSTTRSTGIKAVIADVTVR
jgi:hypothetical protein